VPLSLAQAEGWVFSDVERIVAVGDIHGAYDALVATLQTSNVIDDSLAWSGGKTHFVVTGDLLDRGPDSRRVMDLIIRLEHEARLVGGQVHQLLGNHEVMNLIGDLRYVSDEEYAAFLDVESIEERELWYQRFRLSKPADADEAIVRSEFNEKAPPGYFGHRRAFRHDGVYGKWLLEKPLVIVINDTAFVHGGLPPYVTDHGLTEVNTALKADLHDYVTTVAVLGDADVMSPIDRFKESPAMLVDMLENAEIENEFVAAAQDILALSESPLHRPVGPTWYRGTATCSRLIEVDGLNAALDAIGAKRVVIGHTTTITRRVQQRMAGRIIEIDTGMLKANYQGSGNALIIEDDRLTVVNQDGTTELLPIAHPGPLGFGPATIDDEVLADILTNGTIVDSQTDGTAWRLLQVVADENTVLAYFNELPGDEGFLPDLAAYRLDRMLGLNMVPVTVRREINGKNGTLQFVPAATLSERERVADGRGNKVSCSLEKQWNAMYIFDELMRNSARTPLSMLYSPDNWLLMLVSHEHSFGIGRSHPTYLRDVEFAIGEQWRKVLRQLNNDVLLAELGDVLDKHQLAALGDRRDRLIESSSQP
jgi:calcineurin-like phosphoesterase family protein